MNIPSIIHFIYLGKNGDYPEIFLRCKARVEELHPGWEIRICDDEMAEEMILTHLPFLFPLYKNCVHLVQRVDLLKAIVVYIFGGFYLDYDMYCLKPIDELRSFNVVLSEEKIISEAECIRLGHKEHVRIANYMFGSIPGHAFWLHFLRATLRLPSLEVITEHDILETTGPGLFTKVFAATKALHKDILLLENRDRDCLMDGRHKASCFFGNYAAHLHQGSWRWAGNKSKTLNKDSAQTLNIDMSMAYNSIDQLLSEKIEKGVNVAIVSAPGSSFSMDMLYRSVLPLGLTFNALDGKIRVVCADRIRDIDVSNFEEPQVLYTTITSESDLLHHLAVVNKIFSLCIVFTDLEKKAFLASGLTIPVHVVAPGFVRYPRDFDNDEEYNTFNIGVVVDDHVRSGQVFDDVLKELKDELPVELKVKILPPEMLSPNNGLDTVDGKDRSIWFKDLHCVFILANKHSFPFLAMESLYLGIPTIIDSRLAQHGVIETDLFDVLEIEEGDLKSNLSRSILKIYQEYDNFQLQAANGAAWIEDKFTMYQAQQKMLAILNTLV